MLGLAPGAANGAIDGAVEIQKKTDQDAAAQNLAAAPQAGRAR